jgi:hypothetical protein
MLGDRARQWMDKFLPDEEFLEIKPGHPRSPFLFSPLWLGS